MTDSPLLSIITIVKDDRNGLAKTLNSVATQKQDWCEYVVIDGASTDGTLEVICQGAGSIDTVISEEDSGIANAFNKGINRARGQYFLFLNAGDTLCTDVLKSVRNTLLEASTHGIWVVASRVRLLVGAEGRLVGMPVSRRRQLLRNYLPHQGMLIASEAFRHLGPYDESYYLGMDYEWSLRLYHSWYRLQFINIVLAEMNAEGISMKFYKKTFQAYHQARLKHRMMPSLLSRLVTIFFIAKRTAGERLRNR